MMDSIETYWRVTLVLPEFRFLYTYLMPLIFILCEIFEEVNLNTLFDKISIFPN
jgi:hypothetical protein